MNYGELKVQIAKWAHRTDLGDQLDGFVQNTSQRLGQRFGVMPAPLVSDTDTNSLLTTHPNIYLYGSLREMGIYTHNVDAVQAFAQLYEEQISDMNINYRGLDWDAGDSPYMHPGDKTDV